MGGMAKEIDPQIKKALVHYATVLGMRLFPVHTIENGKCTCNRECGTKNAGKHPRIVNWQDEATTDIRKLIRWFSRWPNSNVGAATGDKSGVFVVDIDNWDAWESLNMELPETLTYTTAGSGKHHWFKFPDNQKITNSRGSLPIGIDIRGTGGFVILPPSKTLKGSYRDLEERDIANAPAWLLEALNTSELDSEGLVEEKGLKGFGDLDSDTQDRYRRYTQGVISGEIAALKELEEFPELPWNNTTYSSACNLFELAKAPWSDLTSDDAETIIRENIPPFDTEGWTSIAVDKLIESAFKKVMHSSKSRPYPPGETRKPTTQRPAKSSANANVPDTIAELSVQWFSEVEDEDYEWYEKDWIPKKGGVLLAGYGGSGKSTLFAYWIRLITTGQWGGEPGNCVYMAREDSKSAIIKPRLIAAGADISKVATILLKEPDFNGEMKERAVSFKRHLEDIRRLIRQIDARAIFLDPGVSFLGIDEDKDSKDMQRTVLEDLLNFAEQENVLIFVIKHYKKNQSGSERLSSRDKLYGSTVWYEVFRHVLSLRKIDEELKSKLDLAEDDPLSALLSIDKNSYGKDDHDPKAFGLEEFMYRNNPVSRFVEDGVRSISTRDVDSREVETDEQADRRVEKNSSTDKWIIDTLNALGGVCMRSKILELREAQKAAPSLSTFKRRILVIADVEKVKGERNNVVIYTIRDAYREHIDPKKDLRF